MKRTDINNPTTFGILEWFRPGEYDQVNRALADLKKLGVSHLRTGISWAEWYADGSQEWFDWLIPTLSKEVDLLPCFLYTPPSIGERKRTSSPPKNLKDYADFLDVIITRYGEHFEWVELWNEPNNKLEYDFTLDYSWNKFSKMIGMAAYWAKHRGKKTLLGGMSPIDPNWLQMMIEQGTLDHIDAIGIHGFPHVFDQNWEGWDEHIISINEVLSRFGMQREIWITEAGFSTWQQDQVKQYEELKNALDTKAARLYWYSLKDLDPSKPTVGGFHLDEREYHFGLRKADGTKKLLFKLLERKGLEGLFEHHYIQKHYTLQPDLRYSLITGGAGFIGTNLAKRLLQEGKTVMIYDNLIRDGVEQNLQWLQEKYPESLIIQIADINESLLLKKCVNHATEVYHFCAQVAVTSSVDNPEHDFEINLKGTFSLLEAIRTADHQPPLVFTSTNKVYGNLLELDLQQEQTRYSPSDQQIKKHGISEEVPLDFHSPYGCSKGAADQYILDYARTYDLKTTVFRMSCIYGPHQFGTEDQGWVAHFLISALEDKPITIYGNGKQVRDILFVDDLVDAFLLAQQHMDQIAGEAFNIGGGPGNTVSLLEILDLIEEKSGKKLNPSFQEWRTGDQQYYVSNTSKFQRLTGWEPQFSVDDGIEALLVWLCKNRDIQIPSRLKSSKAFAL